MSILTINLAAPLRSELQNLNVRFETARDIHHALDMLVTEDFDWIIEDARRLNSIRDEFTQLLAATTPGTQIMALVDKLWLPESEHWRSQGITMFYSDSLGLLPRVLARSD